MSLEVALRTVRARTKGPGKTLGTKTEKRKEKTKLWQTIASCVAGKDANECLQRYKTLRSRHLEASGCEDPSSSKDRVCGCGRPHPPLRFAGLAEFDNQKRAGEFAPAAVALASFVASGAASSALTTAGAVVRIENYSHPAWRNRRMAVEEQSQAAEFLKSRAERLFKCCSGFFKSAASIPALSAMPPCTSIPCDVCRRDLSHRALSHEHWEQLETYGMIALKLLSKVKAKQSMQCTDIHTHTRTQIRTCAHTPTRRHSHVHTHTLTRDTHIHSHAHPHTPTHSSTCTYKHTNTCTRARAHTHTHRSDCRRWLCSRGWRAHSPRVRSRNGQLVAWRAVESGSSVAASGATGRTGRPGVLAGEAVSVEPIYDLGVCACGECAPKVRM